MDGALGYAYEGMFGLVDTAADLAGIYLRGEQEREIAEIRARTEAARIAAGVQTAAIGAPVSVAQSQYLAIAAIGMAAVVVVLMIRRG